MSKKDPFDYHKSSGEYISLAAEIDHKMTMVIIYYFFGFEKVEKYSCEVEDFMKWFVYERNHGLTFGRKISLFTKILDKKENIDYKNAFGEHLTSNKLKSISNHRNKLAHGYYIKEIQDDVGVMLLSPSEKTEDNAFIDSFKMQTHDQMLDLVRKAKDNLDQLNFTMVRAKPKRPRLSSDKTSSDNKE